MNASKLLDSWQLNDEQREAVIKTEGAVRIVAGPGSGKTRVLTHRIAYILQTMLASPHGIIAVTFTRKAAGEMKSRLSRLLPDVNIDDLTVTTFHGLGYRIIQAEARSLGFNPALLRVCMPLSSRHLIRDAMEQLGLRSPWDVDVVARQIEQAKSRLLAPDEFVNLPGDFFEENIARVYLKYQQLLKDRNLVDFGDLVRLAVKVLNENEGAGSFFREMARYVLVDEFQDTGLGQYQLLKTIAGKHGNITVIGDPMQSIYAWRQADPAAVMAQFEKDYPDVTEIVLRRSYRFTRTILDASDAVVKALGAPSRGLTTENDDGDKISILNAESDRDEAMLVVKTIKDLYEHDKLPYNDCAVLTRTGAQRRLLEQSFLRAGIPYQLVGERPFLLRHEVQVMLGYLRLAADPFDAGALARVINTPPRGLGRKTQEKIKGDAFQLTVAELLSAEEADDLSSRVKEGVAHILSVVSDISDAVGQYSLPDLFDYVLERSGYASWLSGDDAEDGDFEALAALDELRRMTLKYPDVVSFLDAVDQISDDLAAQDEGVSLATLHAVKGLEFPVVFITGLEEGVFPHARSTDNEKALEEEYRLFYVGLTRAQRRIYLSSARYRERNGQVREMSPSRLLRILPAELTCKIRESQSLQTRGFDLAALRGGNRHNAT